MSFFYILYILIKKILKILYWGRNLQGRTGKGPKPLGAEPEKGRNLWHSFVIRYTLVFFFVDPLYVVSCFLCPLQSIATHRDRFVRRLSVCPSVCHTFLSYFPRLCFAGDTSIPWNAATIFFVMFGPLGTLYHPILAVAQAWGQGNDYNKMSSSQCVTFPKGQSQKPRLHYQSVQKNLVEVFDANFFFFW